MVERLLIVGLGSIGKRHLRIARELVPEADIRVLRHRPCSEAPQFSDGCMSDLCTVSEFMPQAAIISTPATFHLHIAEELAKIGCHLFIEKPLAANLQEVSEFLELVRKETIQCLVGYNLRYLPSLVEFRRLLHEGVIGKPLSVHSEIGQFLPNWRPGTDYREGVSARHDLGGGVLLELSHEIDYLRWIFGEVKWVSSWVGRLSDLEIDVEDSAKLMMGFSMPGSDAEILASLNMDFIRRDTTRNCIVVGSDGSLRWNGLTGTVECYSSISNSWQEVFSFQHQRNDSYRLQMQHFLNVIEGSQQVYVTGEDGMAVLKIIDAARRSSLNQCQHVVVN